MSIFMPLLTRMPKQRVKAQVVSLAPGAVPSAVLRQYGVPVHDLACSRRRFELGAIGQLMRLAPQFRPDVIQAWGATAQILSIVLLRRSQWRPRLVWSMESTAPLASDAGAVDRWKLALRVRLAARVDRIVYASESGAAQHRRVGFPDGGHLTVPAGVDAVRFKPDPDARRKVREQLQLAPDAFVVGMVAPFQPQSDHATLLKALAELIKTHPQIALVLAGHGVQKGNAPLMALLGNGALATRTHLLGEWSDISALYNACDVVCSSALNDSARLQLAMAMLCGVPVVATGMGAQGELLGQFGMALEPGNPAAFIKALTRLLELEPHKRAHMVQAARKHALKRHVHVRSLQSYWQLYCELAGRKAGASQVAPERSTRRHPSARGTASASAIPASPASASPRSPAIAASTAASKARAPSAASARRDSRLDSAPAPRSSVKLAAPENADSLDTGTRPGTVPKRATEPSPQRSIEQQGGEPSSAAIAQTVPLEPASGDVLQAFERQLAEQPRRSAGRSSERARGVAEEIGDLLPPEALTVPASDPAKPPAMTMSPSPSPVAASPVDSSGLPVATSSAAADPASLPVREAAPSAGFQLELLPEPAAKQAAR